MPIYEMRHCDKCRRVVYFVYIPRLPFEESEWACIYCKEDIIIKTMRSKKKANNIYNG